MVMHGAPSKVCKMSQDCGSLEDESKAVNSKHFQVSDVHWRGVPLTEIHNTERSQKQFPPIDPSPTHSVIFQLPVIRGKIPKSYPVNSVDEWDDLHVRMPHSPKSIYPASEVELRSRWGLVNEVLSRPINSSEELEEAIFMYSSNYTKRIPFIALHTFCTKTLNKPESDHFFDTILPGIIKLALSLPEKIRGGISLLKKHATKSISLSQEQIAVLMANAFLCTFPRKNGGMSSFYPSINFNRLFQCSDERRVQEKIKCFINYFRRVMTETPHGVVTFSRHYVPSENLPDWKVSEAFLPKLHINSIGTIEDEGHGLMEVDFANKLIGGGILGRGSVQEEIKFMICPELVVSRLFTETLDDTEALIVLGCERFNKYSGYGETFTWTGNYVDKAGEDTYGRKLRSTVAIDALSFHQPQGQYSVPCLERELGKAFTGFSFCNDLWEVGVATGNWGCGVYRGDPQLKALLQLMAASEAKRDIAYFTFRDVNLRDIIFRMHEFLSTHRVTVGNLWRIISKFSEATGQDSNVSLYNFIYDSIIKESGATSMIKENEEIEGSLGQSATYDEVMEVLEGKNPTSSGQFHAESYSIKTDEGRKRCILIEKERWQSYETSKRELSASEGQTESLKVNKKLITAYFSKLNK